MPHYRVLITDYAWPDLSMERDILAEIGAELLVAPASDTITLARWAADADAIMTNWARVDSEVLTAAKKCRIVARFGIGLDNIDVACAHRLGMLVTNVPDYCLEEVAEHALALILSLGRKVAFYHQATKLGRYDLLAGPPLRRLAGQTVGIIGFGKIGRALARKASALGFRIQVYTRRRERVEHPYEWTPLDTLLAESDFISLHLPSTPETRHLIGGPRLARMKPTAYLINTSRGALVDEPALAAALAEGRLAGAALDVQQQEPPDLARAPFNDPRVIVTPHAAFYSLESVSELRRRAARQVADALSGKTPENVCSSRSE